MLELGGDVGEIVVRRQHVDLLQHSVIGHGSILVDLASDIVFFHPPPESDHVHVVATLKAGLGDEYRVLALHHDLVGEEGAANRGSGEHPHDQSSGDKGFKATTGGSRRDERT